MSSQAPRPAPSPTPVEPEDSTSRDDPLLNLLKQVAEAPSIEPATLGGADEGRGSLVGQRLAHFQVQARLGAGGMGVVYKAEDARLRRAVALKVLPPSHANDRSRQQRLLREARSAAAVSHPNIAAIYEVGEEAGMAFIAMEYLEGETLRARLGGPPRPPAEVLQWSIQIAQGLARAHQAGIVHRDLKPDNVMLCRDGLIKILDFGLAKLQAAPIAPPPPAPEHARPRVVVGEASAHESATGDGQVVGTPRYMSPEQARGAAVDARSDVYSFGVMLLELCTGQVASAETKGELARALEARPADVVGMLRQGLLRIAARCMEAEPPRRFPDGTALLSQLQALAREAEMAVTPPTEVSSPSGTQRALAALGLLIAAAVLVTGGWILAVRPNERDSVGPNGRLLVRRLTANPPENAVEDAALSPDSKTLAYVDRRGLWLRRMDPVRTDAVKLPDRFTPQAVTWFPRGDALLVVGLSPDVEGSSVYIIAAGGKARLLSQLTVSTPRVSPDGTRIAWSSPQGIVLGSASMEDGAVIVPLENTRRLDRGTDQLSWSPDGNRLAYIRLSVGDAGAEASLEMVDVRTRRVTVLVTDPRLVQENGHGALTWAPDGRILYALAERPPHEPGSTLWAIRPDPRTGEVAEPPRQLHPWVGSFPASLTSSASGALSYVLYESQVDVYVAELQEGQRIEPRRTTLTDHNEQPSGWTADSQAVLFMSDQDGSHDLFQQDLQTQEVRTLLAAPDSQTWPVLAPGGALLYWQVPVRDDDGPRPAELMQLVPGDDAPALVLITRQDSHEITGLPPPSQAHVRCASRGRSCVVGEQDGSKLVFWSLDPQIGRRGALLHSEEAGIEHGWDLSPDGERLALPFRGGQIRTVELSGQRRIQDRVVDVGCDLQFVAWAADGESLFATGICPGERPYKVFLAERRLRPRVLWESSYAWAGHPTPSPDGKALALAIKPFDNDVWLISGL